MEIFKENREKSGRKWLGESGGVPRGHGGDNSLLTKSGNAQERERDHGPPIIPLVPSGLKT